MPQEQKIKILYEDAELIVCIKPAGIASQGGKGFRQDMTDLLKLHIQREADVKGEPYLGVVHRLDQPVGGIMVYAKNAASAASLSAQAASGAMKKRYYAVLEKCPAKKEGVLRDYLLRDGHRNTSCVVPESRRGEKDVKPAELSYRVLKTAAGSCLAEIELKTGRHHQIRVQFSNAGYPLYGDRKYNPKTEGRELALFSHYLEFTHPKTGKRLQFDEKPESGIAADFFE